MGTISNKTSYINGYSSPQLIIKMGTHWGLVPTLNKNIKLILEVTHGKRAT